MGKYEFLNPMDEEGMIYAKNNKYGYIDINQNNCSLLIYDHLSVFRRF